jgi:flagellin-specific chaperone FliS
MEEKKKEKVTEFLELLIEIIKDLVILDAEKTKDIISKLD